MTQKAIVNRALAGGGELGLGLSESQCCYLAALAAQDLGCRIENVPLSVTPFFGESNSEKHQLEGLDFLPLFESLCDRVPDADTYFDCLAALHKRRLKYKRIWSISLCPI